MYLIVGLGNPGKKYERTYHNIGFICLEHFAKKHNIQINKDKKKAFVYEGVLNSKKIILAKPKSFMNLSGSSLIYLMKKYKIKINNVLVIYDDFYTEIGKVKYRNSGSSGGQNGMGDIISCLKTKEIKRIRVGIGSEVSDNKGLSSFVLSKISKGDQACLMDSASKVSEIIEEFIDKDGIIENKTV